MRDWTPASRRASTRRGFVRAVELAQDTPIAVLEEMVYENGRVRSDVLLVAAQAYGKSIYG